MQTTFDCFGKNNIYLVCLLMKLRIQPSNDHVASNQLPLNWLTVKRPFFLLLGKYVKTHTKTIVWWLFLPGWLGGYPRNHTEHHLLHPGFSCGPPLCAWRRYSCPDPLLSTIPDAQRAWVGRSESKIQASNRIIPSVSLFCQDSSWLASPRDIPDAGKVCFLA